MGGPLEERLAPQPTDKPVGIFLAIGIANRTTWRSPQFYVLVVGAMQVLLVLVAIPVIRLLYKLVLVETGLGVSRTTASRMCSAIRWPMSRSCHRDCRRDRDHRELVTLFVLASHHQDRERPRSGAQGYWASSGRRLPSCSTRKAC